MLFNELIMIAVIGFLIGWYFGGRHSRNAVKRELAAQLAKGVEMKPTVPVIQIKIEQQDNGELFAYRLSDGMFLGQADTGKTMVEKLAKRFAGQDVHITIHKEDGAEYVEEFFPQVNK